MKITRHLVEGLKMTALLGAVAVVVYLMPDQPSRDLSTPNQVKASVDYQH